MSKSLKSFFAGVTVVLVVGMSMGLYAHAQTDTVVATVTVQNVSVSVDDGTVAYGTLAVSTSADTVTLGETQTAENDGNVDIDLTIRGEDTTPGDWTLAGTSDADQYVHEFSLDAGSSWTALATTSQALVSDVAPAATEDVDLQITTPTSTTDFSEQTANVIVTASAATP